MTHLDLFSGIGGFALAARWAGFETVQFVEKDIFCQKVLAKNFPGVPCFDDIKRLTRDSVRCGTHTRINVLTGGFPCQPFSDAGEQLGVEDDRYLWPEMLRVIKDFKPDWVIGENVDGFVRMALDLVLSDMEAAGYSCWPVVIPACAVGAPHQRDRVWVVAHSNSIGQQRRQKFGSSAEEGEKAKKQPAGLPQAAAWGKPFTGAFRVANGIPNRMDRIKSLGNAIVPQVAYPILKAIAEEL